MVSARRPAKAQLAAARPDAPYRDCRPLKRSLTITGHRTSISLEDAFWQAFQAVAEERSVAIAVLAAEIDEARGATSLSSAIRLFVLAHVQRQRRSGAPPA